MNKADHSYITIITSGLDPEKLQLESFDFNECLQLLKKRFKKAKMSRNDRLTIRTILKRIENRNCVKMTYNSNAFKRLSELARDIER
jgi:hypothetical protein